MEMNRPFLQVVYVFDKVHRLHLLVLCNSHIWLCSMPIKPELRYRRLFSSPEPKAQVNFSDQNLSVVRRRRCCCRCRYCRCRELFTFSSSSPEPLSYFQPNLAQSSNEGPGPAPRGDNYEKAKIH